jgi:hypothetical protein
MYHTTQRVKACATFAPMTAPALSIDPSRTTVTLRTTTTGLFSPLAHDLELSAGDASGEATEPGASGGKATASVRFPVASIRVVGALKAGAVDASKLSEGDRREIERKIREQVFAGLTHIDATAELDGDQASLSIKGPAGTARQRARVSIERGEGGEREGRGTCKLSLKELGVAPVKGPMGVFRVADELSVEFRVAFKPAG